MILCEQCGNEFRRGNMIERDGKKYIKCPYCNYGNKPLYRRKKKGDTNARRNENH